MLLTCHAKRNAAALGVGAARPAPAPDAVVLERAAVAAAEFGLTGAFVFAAAAGAGVAADSSAGWSVAAAGAVVAAVRG